jgi:hypothetical protein
MTIQNGIKIECSTCKYKGRGLREQPCYACTYTNYWKEYSMWKPIKKKWV